MKFCLLCPVAKRLGVQCPYGLMQAAQRLSINPMHGDALSKRIMLYIEMGKDDQAIEDFAQKILG